MLILLPDTSIIVVVHFSGEFEDCHASMWSEAETQSLKLIQYGANFGDETERFGKLTPNARPATSSSTTAGGTITRWARAERM